MRSIMRSEQGLANLEVMIITGCFAIIIIAAALAMFGQGGIVNDDIVEAVQESADTIENYIEEELPGDVREAAEKADEIKHEVCVKLCEADYEAGVNNVVQFNNCLGNCSQ